MIFLVLVLAAALIASGFCLFLFKRDIKNINRQLEELLTTETNARLSTATFEKNISVLVINVGNLLDKHKRETIAYRDAEQKMKRAITNISHDLRTPLTSSLGYLQLMSHENTDEAKRNEYTQMIEQRLKVLSSYLNQLFEFTQSSEGRSTKAEKLNVCNLLRDCLAEFHNELVQKNFTVEVDIPDAPAFVFADKEDMKRIFQNLIQNVLAHGAEFFHVQIDPEKNVIVFSNRVKEHASIDTEIMFERFYTSDFARTMNRTGLGLAIVKALLDRIGGSVSADVDGDLLNIQLQF